MKKNNYLKILFLLFIIISGTLVSQAYDFEVGGIYYNINGTEATVTKGTSSGSYSGSITIPATVTYNNVTYPVTVIGYDAFEWCRELTDIEIPNSVTLIDRYAFAYCESLTSIVIPNSVTSIGTHAFAYCTELASAIIGNSVSYIDYDSFRCCDNLNNIIVAGGNSTYDSRNNCNAIIETASNTLLLGCPSTIIPNSVTSIGDYAFEECRGLTHIDIPNSVTHIGYSAFEECEGLNSVSIPSSMETIEFDAFRGCWNLQRVDITDLVSWLHISFNYITSNPLSQSSALLYLNDQLIEDLVIPEGITYVNSNSFAGCSVRSVTIPNSVKYIWNNAFMGCGAEKVTIGTGVQRIAPGAFYGSSLRQVIVLSETPPTIETPDYYDDYLPTDCFSSDTYSSAYLKVPNSYLNNYQNAAYWSNFNSIWGIYDFEIDSVYYKKTGDNSVMVCSDETREYYEGPTYKGSVTIPEKVSYKGNTYDVTSVEEYSFCDCDSLTAIILPNSLESIGYYAFGYCPELKTISLGSGLTTIGSYAFMDCNAIDQIKCFALIPPVMSNRQIFDDNVYNTATLELPRTAINGYRSANYWKDFATIKPIPYDFVVDGIYYLITSDNTVSVSYKDTNYNTYSGSVVIPENVVFDGKSYRVTTIGTNSFAYCDELTDVSLPNSITTISGNAFRDCVALSRILIPNSVFSIGNSAFKGCSFMAEVIIGSSVFEIGDEAFGGCSNLTSVTCLPVTPPMISNGSFPNDALYNAAIIVPKSSLSTYKYADYWSDFSFILREYDFEKNGLYYVITGTRKASLAYRFQAYRGHITIPCAINHNGEIYHIVGIEEGAFFRCGEDLIAVSIPNTVLTIGHGAFYHCSGLTEMTIPNSIKRIPNCAFQGCNSLNSLVIGSGISIIEENAFNDCMSLGSIICKATTPPRIENINSFESTCYENAMLKVPDSAVNLFKASNYWKDFQCLRCLSPFAVGDVNGNGSVDISDATLLIDYLLNTNIRLLDEDAADINHDGLINITDVTFLIDGMLGVTDILSGPEIETIIVRDVPFNMVKVEGGTFMMGPPDDETTAWDWWKPAHEVTLTSSFFIGQTEVTQELWLAVMNDVPSTHINSPSYPVETVSWNDCQEFVTRLNALTGRSFRLPTEAEWEFAARGGNKSHGYLYSGSDNVNEVAWHYYNSPSTPNSSYNKSPQPVGLKKANELGLYDMSGNVSELCQDWNGTYSPEPQIDPTGTDLNAGGRVIRGGNADSSYGMCTVWARDWQKPENSYGYYGLRLAMDVTTPPLVLSIDDISIPLGLQESIHFYNGNGSYSIEYDSTLVKCMIDSNRIEISAIGCGNTNLVLTDLTNNEQVSLAVTVTNVVNGKEVFTINGVQFTMVQVQGGTFMMGATPEQGDGVRENEKPVHQVTVSNFSIGETQVTQELWIAVMGYNPSYHTSASGQYGLEDDFQRPVERVYWRDCQMFVKALSALTGREFRLPTEAEWEYAARGGSKSQGFKYAGSNNLDEVAWYWNTTNNRTFPVGTKKANELGLYDMSGNVWEWCQDWYGNYSSDAQIDPTGPSSGSMHIIRGGCFYSNSSECNISRRAGEQPQYSGFQYGLRLAL